MKRILFVDDEPCLLDGLKRMLRPQRKEWDTAFANGGEQALAMLAAVPFDVIVTDMRMPVMDGAQLLERVQKRFPGVIRIILSGQFEMDAALRAAPVAHQFLSKPCDPDRLRGAIDRACSCTKMLPDEAIRRIVGAVGNLPDLPSTSAKLLAAIECKDVNLERIGKIIEQDVGMTAKILQLVNSAFFGRLCQISSVRAAVSYLGLDVLRHLVLSVEVSRTFQPVRPGPRFSLRDFEMHSRLTANLAARLPAPASVTSAAVVAALLHDTGRLVLASRLPAEFEEIMQLACAQSRPPHVLEQQVIGTTHAEIGAYLLGLWGLPEEIVGAVCLHHRPSAVGVWSGQLDTLAVTHLADALVFEAANCGSGDASPGFSLLDVVYLNRPEAPDMIEHWRLLAQQTFQDHMRDTQ
jgi:HD-like signal output (HDOD) protein